MEYRRLGNSGLQLSAISLGTWSTIGERLNLEQSKALIIAALELGINFFDTADVYNYGLSEIALGRTLADFNWPREEYVISTKVFFPMTSPKKPNGYGLSRKHIVEACHASLVRLGLEYIDIYFCHRPDLNTPIIETLQTMSTLIYQGKILYWGTSEWSEKQLIEVYEITKANSYFIPPVAEQSQYNLWTRTRVESVLANLQDEYGLGISVWSPLRSGLLAGRYNRGICDNSRLSLVGYEDSRKEVMGQDETLRLSIVNQLTAYAQNLDVSVATLALAWCLQNKRVCTAIVGASEVTQIVQNCKVFDFAKTLDPIVFSEVEQLVGAYE